MGNAFREEEVTEGNCSKPNLFTNMAVVIGNPVLLHAPGVGCCMGHLVLPIQSKGKESKEDGLHCRGRAPARRGAECASRAPRASRELCATYAARIQCFARTCVSPHTGGGKHFGPVTPGQM